MRRAKLFKKVYILRGENEDPDSFIIGTLSIKKQKQTKKTPKDLLERTAVNVRLDHLRTALVILVLDKA